MDPEFIVTMLIGAFLSLQRAVADSADPEKHIFGRLFPFRENWDEDMITDYIFNGISC